MGLLQIPKFIMWCWAHFKATLNQTFTKMYAYVDKICTKKGNVCFWLCEHYSTNLARVVHASLWSFY
jgi:hypothetical protein